MEVPTNLSAYVRVLKLATKPDNDEFGKVALVAAAGIVLVGTIGFFLFALMSVLPP